MARATIHVYGEDGRMGYTVASKCGRVMAVVPAAGSGRTAMAAYMAAMGRLRAARVFGSCRVYHGQRTAKIDLAARPRHFLRLAWVKMATAVAQPAA